MGLQQAIKVAEGAMVWDQEDGKKKWNVVKRQTGAEELMQILNVWEGKNKDMGKDCEVIKRSYTISLNKFEEQMKYMKPAKKKEECNRLRNLWNRVKICPPDEQDIARLNKLC